MGPLGDDPTGGHRFLPFALSAICEGRPVAVEQFARRPGFVIYCRTEMEHSTGDLAEVLDSLGVFRAAPEDLVTLCPSGFRRVPISTGSDYYFSLQGFAPHQIAYAHTHPDSQEWVVVLAGRGRAAFGTKEPIPLDPGMVLGRGERHPHGFLSGPEPMYLLSIQLPRPAVGATYWDEPGTTTDPVACEESGIACRRCPRCGGHSAAGAAGAFGCENCSFTF